MTGLIGLAYIFTGVEPVVNTYKASFLKYLYFIFWLDALANILVWSRPLNHVIYAIQYSLMLSTISKFCTDKEGFDIVSKLVLLPAFLAGPVIGTIQLVNGGYVFGVESNDAAFIATVMSDAKHGNANYTAIMMLLCLVLFIYLFLRENKYIYLIGGIFSLGCLILTYSRTAIAATVGVLVIFLILFFRMREGQDYSKISIKTFVFLIIAVAVIIFALPFIENAVTDYLNTSDIQTIIRYKQNDEIDNRTIQWMASVKAILQNGVLHFLFGFGDEAYEAMAQVGGTAASSHNFIFGRIVETGILGGICAIALYLKAIINMAKYWKKMCLYEKWVSLGTLAMLLCYLMISIIYWELLIILTLYNSVILIIDADGEEGEVVHE